ncbi:hypothetical protein IHE45_19G013900 [Dioscorea alata]|uniref:Uncharacterized protein n=1 Tax=Dioscorea alata TaxID=55571 RepID=A0ACB7TWF7_DIOAL|nr:hypothetical protein IHE45_19G013900 [Dioscorea alata]
MSSADLLPAPSDKPPVMVGSKIKRLDDPDHRFLRFASPHPFLSDHTSILAATATRVTTLPSVSASPPSPPSPPERRLLASGLIPGATSRLRRPIGLRISLNI